MSKIIIITLISLFHLFVNAETTQLEQMQMQIETLSNEVLKLKNESPQKQESVKSETDSLSLSGRSKVYQKDEGLSIGGYGEIVYQDKKSGPATTDAYRVVPYIGYKFSDKLLLNTEIEVEHSNEIFLEFAYLDFMPREEINFRLGHILIPVGLVNINHEPIYFNSVYRPEIESKIIPSTWHENGLEIHGRFFEKISYSIGVVNSLNLSGQDRDGDPKEYKASSWIREGRQKASKAMSDDLSYFVRLDYNTDNGSSLGASYYGGEGRQGNESIKAARVDLFEAHLNYSVAHFKAMALYTTGYLSDTALLAGDLGKKVEGYYVDLSYDVGSSFGYDSTTAFVRYSQYNLHKEVVDSVVKDPSLDKQIITLGMNYKPHHKVVLKADYQIRENEQGNEANTFNLGLGFVF